MTTLMSRTEKLKMHLDERMIRWGFVCQQINHAYSQLPGGLKPLILSCIDTSKHECVRNPLSSDPSV